MKSQIETQQNESYGGTTAEFGRTGKTGSVEITKENVLDAIFEMLLIIQKELTELRIRFNRLGKELGYEV